MSKPDYRWGSPEDPTIRNRIRDLTRPSIYEMGDVNEDKVIGEVTDAYLSGGHQAMAKRLRAFKDGAAITRTRK